MRSSVHHISPVMCTVNRVYAVFTVIISQLTQVRKEKNG